jgi:hypothetical protein
MTAEARAALAAALADYRYRSDPIADDHAEADRLLAALSERGMTVAPTSQAEAGAALERLPGDQWWHIDRRPHSGDVTFMVTITTPPSTSATGPTIASAIAAALAAHDEAAR